MYYIPYVLYTICTIYHMYYIRFSQAHVKEFYILALTKYLSILIGRLDGK